MKTPSLLLLVVIVLLVLLVSLCAGDTKENFYCRPHKPKGLKFCKDFVTYDIDSRLDVKQIEDTIEAEIKAFNASLSSHPNSRSECIEARKRFSCLTELPYCPSHLDYIQFPCVEVCVDYYLKCNLQPSSIDSHSNAADLARQSGLTFCRTLPKDNCLSLSFLSNS